MHKNERNPSKWNRSGASSRNFDEKLHNFGAFWKKFFGNFRFLHFRHLLQHSKTNTEKTLQEITIRRKTNQGSGLIIYVNHHRTMNNGKSQKFPQLLVYNCSCSSLTNSQHLEAIFGSREFEVFSRIISNINSWRWHSRWQRAKCGGIKCSG